MTDVIEQRLCAAMKAEYKGKGYVLDLSEKGSVRVSGTGGRIAIKAENVPRKVLGLMAEHLGMLPQAGIMRVQKAATQMEMEGASWTWEICDSIAYNTGLKTEDGRRIWRDLKRERLLMAPEELDMVNSVSNCAGDGWIQLCGDCGSAVQIAAEEADRGAVRKLLGL